VLDGVLRSRLNATGRARGRWLAGLSRRNQGATVRRRTVYVVYRGGRPSICPAFRSINDAMHILRRSAAAIDHVRSTALTGARSLRKNDRN